MKFSGRDIVASLSALLGAVVVYASLQNYTWWIVDNWKRSLVMVTLLGLVIFAVYFVDWVKHESLTELSEIALWIIAGTVTLGSLFVETTKTEFLWSASLIGLAWFVQLCVHLWSSSHKHTSHLAHVH
jgi:hypothetical protein